MKRKLLFAAMLIAGALGTLRAQTSLSDPTVVNTSTFTALSGSYTIEVEGTEGTEIQIPYDRYISFKYTPTVTGTIRFISNGSDIFVYEKESSTYNYKGMISSYTEEAYPDMTNDNVSDAINLLGNPDFQAYGDALKSSGRYKIGSPWVISDENLYEGFREGTNSNSHDSGVSPTNCFVWRTDGNYKDKYFYQPVTGLVANGKYKVRFRTAEDTNGPGIFSLRLGSAPGGAEYSKASITVGTGTAKVNTANLTTTTLGENSYFSVYNEANCNVNNTNKSCCQIDYIMLCEANIATGVTGISSGVYVSEAVFPYAAASYAAGDYYLYNEGAGKYVVGANNWGTRASMETSGIKMTATINDGKYTLSTAPTYSGKYLGVDGYVDQGTAQWYFIPTSEDGYIMQCSNGKYLVWDGNSATTTSMVTSIPSDSKGYWTLKSAADRLAVLETATKASPKEATYLIANPDFSRNADLKLWTSTSTNAGEFKVGGGDNISNNLQQWNGYCTVYQDVTNLPNGLYKMTVQGFYRPGDYNTTSTAQNVTIYAGEEEELLMLHTNGAPSSEDTEKGFTADTGLGTWVPNSQTDASKAFSAGYYINEVDNILTTNGTITIGAKNSTELGYQWMVLDNFRLYYYGPTISSTATALPGGSLTADTWYYFDVAVDGDYDLTVTTLSDVVYTTDAKVLVEDANDVTTNFAKKDELALTVGRYYIKSASSQEFSVAAHTYTYVVGDATLSAADGSYTQNRILTITFPDAVTNDPAGEPALAASSKATVNGVQVALSAVAEGFSLDMDELIPGTEYVIAIPEGVYGYEGQSMNNAINLTLNTPNLFDGTYFVRNSEGKYLSRGSSYNTRAIVDAFGLPVAISTNTSGVSQIKYVDSNLYFWDANSATIYSDGSSYINWTLQATTGGYYIINASDRSHNGEKVGIDASNNVVTNDQDCVWVFEALGDHNTYMEALKDAQAATAASAAGISAENKSDLAAELAANYNATPIAITGVDGIQESYQKNATNSGDGLDIYKETVESLTPGLYKLTVNGFYRWAWYTDVEAADGARSNVYLYAGDVKTQLASPFDYPANSAWVSGNDYQDAGGKYYPNNQTGAGKAYDAGNYLNELYVYVSGTSLTFGIKNPNRLAGNDGKNSRGSWLTYRDFTLTRYDQTPANMTITDAKYATFVAPFDVEIPSGVTAYTVDDVASNGSTLEMTEVISGTIEKNTPVVLYSESTVNETFYGKTLDGTPTEGLLTGVYERTAVPDGSYVLQNNEGKVGFYLVDTSVATPYVNANRAYLTIDSGAVKAFFFGEDTATAIQGVFDGAAAGEVYDVAGRKLGKLQKGVNIVNGKKVVVK